MAWWTMYADGPAGLVSCWNDDDGVAGQHVVARGQDRCLYVEERLAR